MVSSSTEVQHSRLDTIRDWFDSHRRWAAVALSAWGILLTVSFYILLEYSQTAGPVSNPPVNLTGLGQTETTGQWQLVMAVHPKCPCTQSSVSELERIVARAESAPTFRFLVYLPSSGDASWMETGLVDRLRKIPGGSILADRDGAEAAALGMHTSGSVLLADEDGKVRFFGGITAARNHEGDSAGKKAVLMLLSGQQPPIESTQVFGCRLENEQQASLDD